MHCVIYLAFCLPFDSGRMILKQGTHGHPIKLFLKFSLWIAKSWVETQQAFDLLFPWIKKITFELRKKIKIANVVWNMPFKNVIKSHQQPIHVHAFSPIQTNTQTVLSSSQNLIYFFEDKLIKVALKT